MPLQRTALVAKLQASWNRNSSSVALLDVSGEETKEWTFESLSYQVHTIILALLHEGQLLA